MLSQNLSQELMQRCLHLAQTGAPHNYALGSLVYKDGQILAETGSMLAGGNDPTAHPEIVVIREAAEKLGARYIPGGVLVSTLEPCPMCAAAAIWAKMDGIIFGASQDDAKSWAARNPGAKLSWRQIDLRCETVINAGNPKLWIQGGVMREACCKLFDLGQQARYRNPDG